MFWLKLTSHDGTPVRVNMFQIADYSEQIEEGGKTFLAYGESGYHVKETVAQIDDALINAASKLRLISGGW